MPWSEVIQATSVVIAALSFAWGVSAWRRAFVGQRRIELAESVLAKFYEAQDAVKYIRNPFSWGNEGASRPRQDGESDAQRQVLDQAYVAFERYTQKTELFAELRSLRYRAMASFGKAANRPFELLDKALRDIRLAARMLGRLWVDQTRELGEDQRQKHRDRISKYEAVFWDQGTDDHPDELQSTIDGAICLVEMQLERLTAPLHRSLSRRTLDLLASLWRRLPRRGR